MRICVKDSVDQKLLEIRAEQFVSKQTAVDFKDAQRIERGDLLAGHKLHRQHARRCEVVDRFGNDDVVKLGEVLTDGVKVVGFDREVELAQKALAQIDEHVFKLV